VFPSMSSDGKTIYFHRHARGQSFSEVVAIANPLYEEITPLQSRTQGVAQGEQSPGEATR
jgi:hypothetical protein